MSQSKINNAFFLIFGQGVNFLFTLFMLPFLVRQLPIETYATYSQILLITSTLYPILSLGIGNGMVAFFNSNNKHNFNIVLNGILNVTFFSLFIYLVLFLSSGLIENQLKNNQLWDFLSFFFFSVCIQIFNDFLFNFMVFSEESKKASLLIIINNILRLSAIYLAIAFNLGLFYIFLFQLVALFLSLFIYLVNIIKKTGLPSFERDKNLNIQLIKLSIPLSLTTIIGVLLIQTDGFVISNYLGKIDYAYYRTGAIEIPFLSSIYGSIALIILPEIKKHLLNLNFEKIIELKRKIILNTALIIY
nr:oligosaccharide flippase family protein [Crocinitomicaceae bacterium]